MPQQWGLDSVAYMDQSYGGTTLADYAINHWFAYPPPRDTIQWWGRYFTTTGGFNPYRGNGEAVALINAIKANPATNHRSGWILPLSDDATNTIINGNKTQGTNAGNAVCQNVSYWLRTAPNMHMPGSGALRIYLDIESTVSTQYWQGWHTAVSLYYYNQQYPAPYYAAAYGHHYSSNCATLASAYRAASFWSNTPEPNCYSPGPAWGPDKCPSDIPPTEAWQYGEHCMSGEVDVDLANTSYGGPYGNGLMDYLIYCA